MEFFGCRHGKTSGSGWVGSGQVLVGLVGFAGQLGHRSKWVSF